MFIETKHFNSRERNKLKERLESFGIENFNLKKLFCSTLKFFFNYYRKKSTMQKK
jgi:hypothetical protein